MPSMELVQPRSAPRHPRSQGTDGGSAGPRLAAGVEVGGSVRCCRCLLPEVQRRRRVVHLQHREAPAAEIACLREDDGQDERRRR